MNIWCANCKAVREMDVHGRCGTCNSEQVDRLDRPNRTFPFSSFMDSVSKELDEVNERLIRARRALEVGR